LARLFATSAAKSRCVHQSLAQNPGNVASTQVHEVATPQRVRQAAHYIAAALRQRLMSIVGEQSFCNPFFQFFVKRFAAKLNLRRLRNGGDLWTGDCSTERG
jgi:hypothetical protein